VGTARANGPDLDAAAVLRAFAHPTNLGEETMKKLRRSSLSGDAYTFVRALFLSGNRYSPGDKVSVEELSRELGVSRTPLWGAIYRLEA